MAGTIRWDVPPKEETQTNTPSLSTLKEMFGFPTDGKEARRSESVDFAVMKSESVVIYAISLSVIPANT